MFFLSVLGLSATYVILSYALILKSKNESFFKEISFVSIFQ